MPAFCWYHAFSSSLKKENRKKCAIIRSSRLAELQSAVAFASAVPRAGDSIAGTLIAVIAAASDSTASAFCDLVFCRSDTITAISVRVTANALTICATATNACKSIRPGNTLSGKQAQTKRAFLISDSDRINHTTLLLFALLNGLVLFSESIRTLTRWHQQLSARDL